MKIALTLIFSLFLISNIEAQEQTTAAVEIAEINNRTTKQAAVTLTPDPKDLSDENLVAMLPNGTRVQVIRRVDWEIVEMGYNVPGFLAKITFVQAIDGKEVTSTGYVAFENLLFVETPDPDADE